MTNTCIEFSCASPQLPSTPFLRGSAIAIQALALAYCFAVPVSADPMAPVPVVESRSEETGGQSPLCGIYALAGALRAIDVPVQLEKLVDPEFVSSNRGSLGDDLVAAARALGADAFAANLTLEQLRRVNTPVLLLLNVGLRGAPVYHWVTYLGERNGASWIFDPPVPPAPVDHAILLSHWDGRAVVVTSANAVFQKYSVRLSEWLGMSLTTTPLILAAIVFCFFAKERSNDRRSDSTWAGRKKMTYLLLFSAVWGLTYHISHPFGFAKQPEALRWRLSASRWNNAIPNISSDHLISLMKRGVTPQIVDARLARDFRSSHLPEAISLPIDAKLIELQRACELLDPKQPIVVYCQSEHCGWSRDVARLLQRRGFTDVQVLTEGYEGWLRRQQRPR